MDKKIWALMAIGLLVVGGVVYALGNATKEDNGEYGTSISDNDVNNEVVIQGGHNALVVGEASNYAKLQMYSSNGAVHCCGPSDQGAWECSSGEC